jgi:hypothetical protein
MEGAHMHRIVCVVCLTLVAVLPVARAADWEAPKDEKFTEKQVENYAAATKELFGMMKAMGKAAEGASGPAALALMAGLDDKVNAIVAKHGMERREYEWLGNKIFENMGMAMIDETMDKAKEDLAKQKKKLADDLAAAQKKLADYQQAQKDGKRVLTKEQREELVKRAKEEQASAQEEVKQHEQEAKDAETEAKTHDSEAAEAEKLAKNPPGDVSADDRPDYVKGKKEEAENARNAAKEVRERVKEAQKAVAESKAKVAAALSREKNPEVPVTDEEKAQVKEENERGSADAKSEVETTSQAVQLLKDNDAAVAKQEAEMHKNVIPENLALVKKHLKELREAWGMAEENK